MKDLLLGVHVVGKTLNLEISRYRLRRLREKILLKCVPHGQHDYFSSFNQSDHLFLVLSLPLPSSLLKLPKKRDTISKYVARDEVNFKKRIPKLGLAKFEVSLKSLKGILDSISNCFLDSGIRITLHYLKRILP